MRQSRLTELFETEDFESGEEMTPDLPREQSPQASVYTDLYKFLDMTVNLAYNHNDNQKQREKKLRNAYNELNSETKKSIKDNLPGNTFDLVLK